MASFGYEGSACRLSEEQQDKLKVWITETLPRTTRAIGAWIEQECGIAYQGRSGLIALLHRLGMEHRQPKAVSRKLDPEKQATFIKAYENLLNHMSDDEAVRFGDALHPTHAVRPVGCWGPQDTKIAVEQTSGRASTRDTVLPVKRWMLILAALDLVERVGVLAKVKDKAHWRARACAGLRPSLTTTARAD